MPHYSTFTLLDYSGEKTNTQIYNGAVTAASITGFITEFGQMRAAIDGITLGTLNKEKWVGDETNLSAVPPTNVFAQREMKWLVRYRGDTTQKIFTLELGTADPTARLLPNSDFADLTQTEVAAFVTRFESFARTPESDTETVTVLSMQLVGRNL